MTSEPAQDMGPLLASQDREATPPDLARGGVRFTIWGRESIQKTVNQSGKSGRVYLPRHWVGSRVVVIRLEK